MSLTARLALIAAGALLVSAGSLPAAAPTGPVGASPASAATTPTSGPVRKNWVSDEAEVFGATQRARLNARVQRLFDETASEITLATRVVSTFDGFETACEKLFRDTVKEAGHYRIVLIVLGYEATNRSGGKDRDAAARPGTGRGKVYSGLGVGLSHVLTREKLESLVSGGGRKLTPDSMVATVESLAASLEQHFRKSLSVAATIAPTTTAPPSSARLRIDLIAGVIAAICVVLLYRRFTRCPQCGARLRKQVKIMPAGLEGGSHAVRRTAKCFLCGYVRKGGWV